MCPHPLLVLGAGKNNHIRGRCLRGDAPGGHAIDHHEVLAIQILSICFAVRGDHMSLNVELEPPGVQRLRALLGRVPPEHRLDPRDKLHYAKGFL